MTPSEPHLKTVDRALQVLLQFSDENPELGIAELAQTLGLHRSIVYRILTTLERRGFVARPNGSTRFHLGIKFVELGNVVLSGMNLRQIAYPVEARLVRETGKSACLTVVSGDESVCIDRVDSSREVQIALAIGGRYPLYAGASNRILLAYLPSDAIDSVISKGLDPQTPYTITNPKRLKDDLARIREQGWVYTASELTPGVGALAAPLRDSNGQVVAGLSIADLATGFAEDALPALIAKICQAAEEISAQLVTWHRAADTRS